VLDPQHHACYTKTVRKQFLIGRNNALTEEVTAYHDVPQDKIIITGAPVFDFWFEMKPTLGFHSFAAVSASVPICAVSCIFVLYRTLRKMRHRL
jgi:hypothetical protein